MKQHLNKYSYYILVSALLILSFVVYQRSFGYNFFIFDDNEHYQKALLYAQKDLLTLIFQERTMMPIFYKFWGMFMFVSSEYHQFALRFLNLSFHLINTILLYFCLQRLLKREHHSFLIAIISVLFFVHPSHVESVVWVSSFKGIVSTTFIFCSWLLWDFRLKYPSRLYRYVVAFLSLMAFGLALMSKVTIVFVPFAFLILDFMRKPPSNRLTLSALVVPLAPFFVLSFIFGAYQVWSYQPGIEHHIGWYITNTIYNHQTLFFTVLALTIALIAFVLIKKPSLNRKTYFLLGVAALTALLSPWFQYFSFVMEKIRTMTYVFAFSLLKIIAPVSYSFDYGIHADYIKQFVTLPLTLSLLLSTAFCLYLMNKSRHKMNYFVLAALYLIFSLPFSGLFYFDFANISYYADRFAYLSTVPVIIIGLLAIDDVGSLLASYRKPFSLALIGFMLTIYSTLSYQRVSLWKNSGEVLKHSLHHNPLSVPLHMALAQYYENEDFIPEALATYQKLSFLHPDHAGAYLARIKLLIEIKEYKQAIKYIRLLMTSKPKFDYRLFYYLGQAYFLSSQYTLALPHLIKAREFFPGDSSIQKMLTTIVEKSQQKVVE